MIINNNSNVQYSFELPDGSIETESKDSNIVSTEILTYSFTKVKTTNKNFLQEGEVAEQTVTLTNNSQATITNQTFNDTMTQGATYVPGSVTIDNVSYPAYDLVAGFPIADLAPSASTVIKYNITADNPLTNPLVNNYGTLLYYVNGTQFNENTNTINIPIVSGRMGIVKQVDKAFAVQGDTLHYTSTIVNSGTLPKTNITFIDTIPAGTTFVAGSVKIDGVAQPGYNPNVGFALADMAVGESRIVEFDVTVN